MGSLFDLLGAHTFISFSSPLTKSSSRSSPGRSGSMDVGCHESVSINSSRALFLALMSSDPGITPQLRHTFFSTSTQLLHNFYRITPLTTCSRTEQASLYRACFIRQSPKLQALFASGSIIWAFL
jgi:hypothetical protein